MCKELKSSHNEEELLRGLLLTSTRRHCCGTGGYNRKPGCFGRIKDMEG